MEKSESQKAADFVRKEFPDRTLYKPGKKTFCFTALELTKLLIKFQDELKIVQ